MLLGITYFEGWGVLTDYAQGHMWLSIAAWQGNKAAPLVRNAYAKKMMTPSQIEKGLDRADECLAKGLKDC
jgi:TPR repeat protein